MTKTKAAKKVRVTFYLEPSMADRLRKRAKRKGLHISALVRAAVTSMLRGMK